MATIKQKRAFTRVVENGGNVSRAMMEVGFSPATAKTPQKLTTSKGWQELMELHLSDASIAKRHKELLNSHFVDHMVFPLAMTEKEITALLLEVNCVARRFMHAETQTHVWFFAPDNKARKDAIDMAYKLKGRYEEKSTGAGVNILIVPPELIKKYDPHSRPEPDSERPTPIQSS